MVISNSDRSAFKNCRRKWDFGSPNRQNLRVIQKQGPLWLGTLIHNCLEDYYGGKFANVFEAFGHWSSEIPFEEKVEYADELGLASVMAEHYSLMYPDLAQEAFEVLHVEMPFQIPLGDGGVFAGTIDGVIRWKATGRVACLEHKTFSRHKDPRLHAIDDQTSIYPAALNLLIKEGKVPGTTKDDFCDTVLYNGLWKKRPPAVKLDAKGFVAKTSLGVTTPEWVERGLKNLPHKPVKKLDNLSFLEHNRQKYFPRFKIYRGEKEQQLAVNRLLQEYQEMTRPDLVIYHNPTTECAWKCGFIPLCEAANSGACTKSIIEASYEKRPSRGPAYEKENK